MGLPLPKLPALFKPPLARRTDPATSRAAAEKAKEFANAHHGLILECLRKYGPLSKTGIAAHVRGLDHVAACRRLSELERMNLARPTGKTIKSTSGREERVWEAL